MIIRKVPGREAGYTVLSNDLLNDRLSWDARGLLVFLVSKPDDWQVCVSALVNETAQSARPAGRDKVYAILKELRDMGYIIKQDRRGPGGKFLGVEYIVSSEPFDNDIKQIGPLTDNPETAELPFTDLPDTAEPLTANPTQQSNDKNKVKTETNVEASSTTPKKGSRKRQKHTYSHEFEQFFKGYPKTNGSKLSAWKAFKRLSKPQKDQLFEAISVYKEHLAREKWKQAMIPSRFMNEEHYLVFQPIEQPQKAAESVLINNQRFLRETVIELVRRFYKSSEPWKYESMLGFGPDDPRTPIPRELILEAQGLVNAH